MSLEDVFNVEALPALPTIQKDWKDVGGNCLKIDVNCFQWEKIVMMLKLEKNAVQFLEVVQFRL